MSVKTSNVLDEGTAGVYGRYRRCDASRLKALRDGDLEALAATYLKRAKLELSVPGERVRRPAAEESAARFRPGVVAEEWSAREWPAGAAVTLQRGAWRQRHYLHFSSAERVAAHWVYAAGVVPEPGELALPPVVGDARPLGGGDWGAPLWRVLQPDGSLMVVKEVGSATDWIARAVGGGTDRRTCSTRESSGGCLSRSTPPWSKRCATGRRSGS